MSSRTTRLTAAGLGAALAVGLTATTHQAASAAPPQPATSQPSGDHHDALPDLDRRGPAVPPTSQQRAALAGSAAGKAATSRRSDAAGPAGVTWNRFGAPATYSAGGAAIATGLGSDPVAAARAFLTRERASFGLTQGDVAAMEVVTTNPVGSSTVVMLRQTFGGVSAGIDGLAVVAVDRGTVRFVSSTLTPQTGAPSAATTEPATALGTAARSIGARAAAVKERSQPQSRSTREKWRSYTAEGLTGTQRVQQVAIPYPGQNPRMAYQVEMFVDGDEAYTVYVDARDGSVIAREDLVDYDSDNPTWSVFTSTPATDLGSTDTRTTFCWLTVTGCGEVVGNPSSPKAWDVDPTTSTSTFTSDGNNARSYEQWRTTPGPTAPAKADRNYVYPWTNQWAEQKCDPANYTTPQRNDIDAATANLFAMHNRMHDWSYKLGFTETAWNLQKDNYGKGGLGGDAEQGRAQSGAQVGLRNNANQGTGADGGTAQTNMYLWQPQAGAFYPPCVDGSYDMSVIGHEYGHAISNRMAGGPNMGLSGLQAGAMGESWSDLMAMEYLQENGYVAVGGTPTPMGAYVTGNPTAGIRNYNMGQSPLNYSNVGYDLTGPQVHADGELWSATNNDIRTAMLARYGQADAATQKACANGERAVTTCPGNRRWIQLVFDAWLLMPSGAVSMVDARNAMMAADFLRFGGANQSLLWDAFAKRGLGDGAASNGSSDTAPTPSFVSRTADNATLRFNPVDEDGRPVAGAALYVGDYSGRSRAVADTDPATALSDTFRIVPGATAYTATAPGFGHVRTSLSAKPGQTRDFPVKLLTNLASSTGGASIAGEGNAVVAMVDGSEGSTATTVDRPTAAQKAFTIDLVGGRQVVRRVQVSALPAPGSGIARFQSLRAFTLLACDAKGRVLCTQDADFRQVYASPLDAFPSGAPRPTAPTLNLRSFDVPQVNATHLRFVVAGNQCQLAPVYAGEQDKDPGTTTDCAAGYSGAEKVGITEVQVFRK